jgi:hypothetical protein
MKVSPVLLLLSLLCISSHISNASRRKKSKSGEIVVSYHGIKFKNHHPVYEYNGKAKQKKSSKHSKHKNRHKKSKKRKNKKKKHQKSYENQSKEKETSVLSRKSVAKSKHSQNSDIKSKQNRRKKKHSNQNKQHTAEKSESSKREEISSSAAKTFRRPSKSSSKVLQSKVHSKIKTNNAKSANKYLGKHSGRRHLKPISKNRTKTISKRIQSKQLSARKSLVHAKTSLKDSKNNGHALRSPASATLKKKKKAPLRRTSKASKVSALSRSTTEAKIKMTTSNPIASDYDCQDGSQPIQYSTTLKVAEMYPTSNEDV